MKIMILAMALCLSGCIFHDHTPPSSTDEARWDSESAARGRMHHYNHI